MQSDRGSWGVLILLVIGLILGLPGFRADTSRTVAESRERLVDDNADSRTETPNARAMSAERPPNLTPTSTPKIAEGGADTPQTVEPSANRSSEESATVRADGYPNGYTYNVDGVQPLDSAPSGPKQYSIIYFSTDELKALYRNGLSECRGLGVARDDCVKGVTSVVFARIALYKKMDGTWILSDGTILGTLSIYQNGIPQFSPWVWDQYYPPCQRETYDPKRCLDGHSLEPYIAPVHAAVVGDGGPCAGYLYFGHEAEYEDFENSCAVRGSGQTMFFHNGWGWHGVLDDGEWLNGLPTEEE